MKQSNQIKEMPLTSVIDQSWASFLNPAPLLRLNALDFSDLWDEEDLGLDSAEEDGGAPANHGAGGPEIPPAPPIPPPLPPSAPPLPAATPPGRQPEGRTLRLHWRELQSLSDLPRVTRFGSQTIWAGLEPVRLDTNRLEYLFERKANSAICCTVRGWRKPPPVSVLGVKRSNIVNIALNRLPPPHLLPPAIYSMDASVLDREDLQRLQALVPSEEELVLIREARAQAPRSPLAAAELCLLTLGDIPHLSPRLQLWAFTLDYDTLEREIAEPLFHLKLAMEQLSDSQTFRCILATVLAIGNFLNGCKARGFELSYLGKLSQVRDTHSRRPLLHHVCVLLLQLYPRSSDLYSDIAAVTRASKCDYSQVQSSLSHLEGLCKASREQVRLLGGADERRRGGGGGGGGGGEREEQGAASPPRRRLPGFLAECEERLRVLRAVHRRVINRFHSFLLFLGYSRATVRDTGPEVFCKTVSDFSLEYRAVRLSVLQQREREGERERGGGGGGEEGRPGTPTTSRKHPQTPDQEHVQQCKLEELLKTPDPAFRLDLTLRRHRSQRTDNRGRFSQRLKW